MWLPGYAFEFTPENHSLGLQQGAFLPSVRAFFITPEFTPDSSSLAFLLGASCLRDCLMLLLAYGRNAI